MPQFEKNYSTEKVAAYFPNQITESKYRMVDGEMVIETDKEFKNLLSSIYRDILESDYVDGEEDRVAFIVSKVVRYLCDVEE